MLTNGYISEDTAEKIESACREEFGEEPPVLENIIDGKILEGSAKSREKQSCKRKWPSLKLSLPRQKHRPIPHSACPGRAATVRASSLNVSDEKAEEIETRIIDGRRFIVIPIEGDETAIINGVETEL